MVTGWASLTSLQKAGVATLALVAVAGVILCVWYLVMGRRYGAADDEFREAVRRKLRDDARRPGGGE